MATQQASRKAARKAGSVDELEREVFRVAAGGEDGCRLVRDQRFIEELVDMIGSWIEAQDLAVPGLIDCGGSAAAAEVDKGHPEDLDRDFLLQAETGLVVGILRAKRSSCS